jgi:hypothetical protein
MVILTLLFLGSKCCSNYRVFMFATLGQVYKTFYKGYLLSFYGMYCNKKIYYTG